MSSPTFTTILCKDAATTLTGSEFMLGPGQERTFRGAPVPKHRRQIVISHEGARDGSTGIGAIAHVSLNASNNSEPDGDSGTSSGATPPKIATIFPLSNVTFFTNSNVTIRNNTTAKKLLLRVAESFYE